MNRQLFIKSFSLIFMLALTVLGFAQTGKINGVIEDPKGNKLSDVKVMADGPTKGVAFSDLKGDYEIKGLCDGSYVL